MLIIDAYNLLHAPMPVALAGLDEARLCHLLGSRSQSPRQSDRVVIVCDGRPKPLGLTKSPVESVELRYSGPNRSADDVIIEMIDSSTAPRSLIIVSSDRQIRRAARRRRATSLTAQQFIGRLAASLSSRHLKERAAGKKKADVGPLTSDEVRNWLNTFAIDPDEERVDPDKFPWDDEES